MMSVVHDYAKENALTFLGKRDNRFPSVIRKVEVSFPLRLYVAIMTFFVY